METMNLGAFSISLAVKNLDASMQFYNALGFEQMGGNVAEKWVILKSPDDHVIGLFEGMFEQNIMTFNPGWRQDGSPLDEYTDVRALQQKLRANGIEIQNEADEASTGAASFMVTDPDGNAILVDQPR